MVFPRTCVLDLIITYFWIFIKQPYKNDRNNKSHNKRRWIADWGIGYRGNIWPQSRGFRSPSCCAIPRNCIPLIYRWWLKRWMRTFHHHSPRESSGGLGEGLISCVPLTLCFCSTQSGEMTLDIYCPLLSLSQIDAREWIFCQSGTKDLWFVSYIMIYLLKYTALMNLHRLQINFCILALVLFLLHVANYLYHLDDKSKIMSEREIDL